jgi:hypothetical protein
MSPTTLNCPNCGAGVKFGYASSVQALCVYCGSVLVRSDIVLEKIGEVSDLPQDASPIQIGTEGIYRAKGFVVVGRLSYEYNNGAWNEWHLAFSDGRNGWLSDAQLEYAVSTLLPDAGRALADKKLKLSKKISFGGQEYEVTSITEANYRGTEGELPFKYWDKDRCTFIDLRSHTRKFATIDNTEDPPLVFVGEFVSVEELRLKNLRRFEGWS